MKVIGVDILQLEHNYQEPAAKLAYFLFSNK